jgi:hypothetical protein
MDRYSFRCKRLSLSVTHRFAPAHRRVKKISRTQSAALLTILRLAGFCHLSRLISLASRGNVAEIGCRQHQPGQISQVFTRKSTDPGRRETSNLKSRIASGRADVAQTGRRKEIAAKSL